MEKRLNPSILTHPKLFALRITIIIGYDTGNHKQKIDCGALSGSYYTYIFSVEYFQILRGALLSLRRAGG